MLYKLLAPLLSRPLIAEYLIARSTRTPYFAIVDPASGDLYMNRFWLFNPYPWGDQASAADKRNWLLRRLPSIRIHHILQPDRDRHLHDHPWDARTFILKGQYLETRLKHERLYDCRDPLGMLHPHSDDAKETFWRCAGDTIRLDFETFHKIDSVSPGGCWTLFVTGPYRGPWGFLVGDRKILWREYLSRFRHNLSKETKKP